MCPRCSEHPKPCSDSFGSNATPLGGSAGRADAAVGAVEAQKAEGVLHIHLYIFFQCAHQFLSLFEIAERIRNHLLSVESFKDYINSTRVAAYPDIEEFERTVERIE